MKKKAKAIELSRPAGYALRKGDADLLSIYPDHVRNLVDRQDDQHTSPSPVVDKARELLEEENSWPSQRRKSRPPSLRPSRREHIFWWVATRISSGHSKKSVFLEYAEKFGLQFDTVKREFSRQKKSLEADPGLLELVEEHEGGEVYFFVAVGEGPDPED